MKPAEDQSLIEVVRATGEIYGKQVSMTAAVMFLADLDGYESHVLTSALSRCRKELRTFPTVADVIGRIDDGRPGVEEAWAMIPKDEAGSVVWNDEIAEAYGICRGLIEGDPIAARMAFKESYLRIAANARSQGIRPTWTPSLGHDKHGREAAIKEALDKNRIALEHAEQLMPQIAWEPKKRLELAGPAGDVKGIVAKLFQDMPKEPV
jgi:hypothetical protein